MEILWSAEFKVSPIVPESTRDVGEKKENMFGGGDELHLEYGQCHGGDAAFVCKTIETQRRCPLSTPRLFLAFSTGRHRNQEQFAEHAVPSARDIRGQFISNHFRARIDRNCEPSIQCRGEHALR